MNKYDKLAIAIQKFHLALINCDIEQEVEKLKPSLHNISRFSNLLFKDTMVSDYLKNQINSQILRVRDNLNSNYPKDSIQVESKCKLFKIERKINSVHRFFEIYDSMRFPELYMISKINQHIPLIEGHLYNNGKFGSAVQYQVVVSGATSIGEFMNELKIRNIDKRVKDENSIGRIYKI